MVAELAITLRDEEKKLTKKFLTYMPFQCDENDIYIKECVQSSLKEFTGTPDSISVKINLEIN